MILRDLATLFILAPIAVGACATTAANRHGDHCVRRISQEAFDSCMRGCHVIQGEPFRFRTMPRGHLEEIRQWEKDNVTLECEE